MALLAPRILPLFEAKAPEVSYDQTSSKQEAGSLKLQEHEDAGERQKHHYLAIMNLPFFGGATSRKGSECAPHHSVQQILRSRSVTVDLNTSANLRVEKLVTHAGTQAATARAAASSRQEYPTLSERQPPSTPAPTYVVGGPTTSCGEHACVTAHVHEWLGRSTQGYAAGSQYERKYHLGTCTPISDPRAHRGWPNPQPSTTAHVTIQPSNWR
eukprot:3496007-Pleurochrysis_carterae.AAC.10